MNAMPGRVDLQVMSCSHTGNGDEGHTDRVLYIGGKMQESPWHIKHSGTEEMCGVCDVPHRELRSTTAAAEVL